MGFDPFGSTFDIMFSVIPVIVVIGFIGVLTGLIFGLLRGAKERKKNNASPVLTVDATMVTKRTDIRHHDNSTGMDNTTFSSTTYYATFQVASGDRMEFKLSSSEYGMLAEQDAGKLTFQGTRFIGFTRELR